MNNLDYYDTICLSGGGIRGLCFIGVLDYLQVNNYIDLNKITHWIGTSAGSLLSFLLILGYTTNEIGNFVLDFNFQKLESDINIENLLINFGINNGSRIIFLLINFLKEKFNINDVTFKELFNLTNKKLSIIGTNYIKCSEEIFNYEVTPDMSVIMAVRISISIPLIFTPVLYNNNYYIDGALVNNFPINYCDPKKTLGIYIKNGNNNIPESISSLISGCISILSDTISCKYLNSPNINIIKIDCNFRETSNFNIDRDQKLKIIKTGQIYAKKYIENLPMQICKLIIDNIILKVNSNIDNLELKYCDKSTQTKLLDNLEYYFMPTISIIPIISNQPALSIITISNLPTISIMPTLLNNIGN